MGGGVELPAGTGVGIPVSTRPHAPAAIPACCPTVARRVRNRPRSRALPNALPSGPHSSGDVPVRRPPRRGGSHPCGGRRDRRARGAPAPRRLDSARNARDRRARDSGRRVPGDPLTGRPAPCSSHRVERNIPRLAGRAHVVPRRVRAQRDRPRPGLDPDHCHGLGIATAIETEVPQRAGAVAFRWLVLGMRRVAPGVRGPSAPQDLLPCLPFLGVGSALVVRTWCFPLVWSLTLATAVATRVGNFAVIAHLVAFPHCFMIALQIDGIAVAGRVMVGPHQGEGNADDVAPVAVRLRASGLGVAPPRARLPRPQVLAPTALHCQPDRD